MLIHTPNTRHWPWHALVLLLAIAAAVIVPFMIWGAQVEHWTRAFVLQAAARPWVAAAVLGGLLAVDVVAPVPSSLVSTACGGVLGFPAGLLTSFVGMTLSATLGFELGRCAAPRVRRRIGPTESEALRRLYARWGLGLLAATRPVPVLAEAAVIFAGLSRARRRVVLPVVALANLGVSAVYAAVGAWASEASTFLPAFLAALLIPGLGMWIARRKLNVER